MFQKVDAMTMDLESLGLVASKASEPIPQQKLKPLAKYKRVNIEQEFKKRSSEKTNMNLVIVGHVDAGKSTLMGHLLLLLGEVNNRTISKYKKEAEEQKKGSFSFAWVLDETEDERSRFIALT